MPENSRNERPFVPAGERIAMLEVHVSAIRDDVALIKEKMEDLSQERTSQHAYVQIGKVAWGVFERVALMLFGSAAAWWLQRHGPGAN